ncbi:hypothetical protein [Brevibacterium linens]|uniref:Uncharacterized protein n=1 Tax=Brevibacterium linens TaxID=1703 RepID=A0A2H1IKX0_BRELN|nr:hypothetical protein [Brevibacterium linens]SMX75804.1 hypothetical protein BLIN101_01307 [Brevibacterium linens]
MSEQPIGNVITQARAPRIAWPVAAVGGWIYDSPERVRIRRARAVETAQHMPSQAAVDRTRIEDGAARTHLGVVVLAVIVAAIVYPWVAMALTPWLLLVHTRRRAATRNAPMTMLEAAWAWRSLLIPIAVVALCAWVWTQVPSLAWTDLPTPVAPWLQAGLPGFVASAGVLTAIGVAVLLTGRTVRNHANTIAVHDDVRALVGAAVAAPDSTAITVASQGDQLCVDVGPVRTTMTQPLTQQGVDARLALAQAEWVVEAVSGLTVTVRPVTAADEEQRAAAQQTAGLLGGLDEGPDRPDIDWDGWRDAA